VDLFSTAVAVDGAGDIEAEAEDDDVVVGGAVVVYEDEDEVATVAAATAVVVLLGTLGIAAAVAVVAGR